MRQKYAILAILVFLLFFFGLGIVRGIFKDARIKKEIARLEDEEKSLAVETFESVEFLKKIQDKEFIEKEAKEKLGLAKPGEHVVIFASSSEILEKKNSFATESGLTNGKLWWYYFFAPDKLEAKFEALETEGAPKRNE